MKLINDIDTSNLLINLDELDSMNIERLFDKGVNQSNYGYTREAYLIFKKVVEIDPAYIHNPEEAGGDNAYFYLGAVYRNNIKDIDGAIELFTKSVELCPRDCASWEYRGYCWMDKGEYEKAIADFENALKGDFGEANEGEIMSAIEDAKEAIKKGG